MSRALLVLSFALLAAWLGYVGAREVVMERVLNAILHFFLVITAFLFVIGLTGCASHICRPNTPKGTACTPVPYIEITLYSHTW